MARPDGHQGGALGAQPRGLRPAGREPQAPPQPLLAAPATVPLSRRPAPGCGACLRVPSSFPLLLPTPQRPGPPGAGRRKAGAKPIAA